MIARRQPHRLCDLSSIAHRCCAADLLIAGANLRPELIAKIWQKIQPCISSRSCEICELSASMRAGNSSSVRHALFEPFYPCFKRLRRHRRSIRTPTTPTGSRGAERTSCERRAVVHRADGRRYHRRRRADNRNKMKAEIRHDCELLVWRARRSSSSSSTRRCWRSRRCIIPSRGKSTSSTTTSARRSPIRIAGWRISTRPRSPSGWRRRTPSPSSISTRCRCARR